MTKKELEKLWAQLGEKRDALISTVENAKTNEEIDAAEMELRKLAIQMDSVKNQLGEIPVEDPAIRNDGAGSNTNPTEQRGLNPIAIAGMKNPITDENPEGYGSIKYRKAFMDFVCRGVAIPQELRSDETTATSDISAVIPNTIVPKIIEKLEAIGMILPLVTKTSYKGGVTIPTSSVKPVATWVAEGAGSDKQKKTTGSITFAYHKLRCAISMTLETTVTSLDFFETTFINNVAEAMVKAQENSVINGTGSSQPKGILTETAIAAQTLSVSTLSYADLINAEAALPLAYESKAVWCMTKKTFMAYMGLTDSTGQPIARINYGLAGKPERTLLGRTVVLTEYMDSFSSSLATGKIFAFLFNFADYVINTNYAMTIKLYEDNDTDDQIVKAVMLTDGKIVDKNSLVVIKKSAAA